MKAFSEKARLSVHARALASCQIELLCAETPKPIDAGGIRHRMRQFQMLIPGTVAAAATVD